jgi:hypothetical protein
MELLILGATSAFAILALVFKFGNLRKVLAFDIPIDIGSTLLLGWAFLGTFRGMVIAVIGGAIISIVLLILKKIVGHDVLTWRGWVKGPDPLGEGRKQWNA